MGLDISMKEQFLKVLPGNATCSDEAIEESYGYAYNYYQMGDYDAAVNSFLILVAIRPRERRFWNALAASMQMKRDYRDAIQAYGMAAIYDSDNKDPFPHFYAAQCYHSLGEYGKALEVLRAAAHVAGEQPHYRRFHEQVNLLRKSWKQQRGKSL